MRLGRLVLRHFSDIDKEPLSREQSNQQRWSSSKSNEHERGGTRDPGFGLGCGEMIAENGDKPPTAEVAPF